jgi:hypothetical protein
MSTCNPDLRRGRARHRRIPDVPEALREAQDARSCRYRSG